MLIDQKLITDNCVLQAGVPLFITGKSTCKNAQLVVSLDDKDIASSVTNADGWFYVALPPQEYDTLNADNHILLLSVPGLDSITLYNIAFGDVFCYFGQSNAGKPRVTAVNAKKECPRVRVYRNKWYDSPGRHPLTLANMLCNYTGHVVGLINQSVGGSRIEQWNSTETKNFRRLIDPVAGYPCRFLVWWQGEGNASSPAGYGSKLRELISEIRGCLGDTVPSFVVKIPTGSGPFTPLARKMHEEYVNLPEQVYVIDTDGLIGGANGHIHPDDFVGYADRIFTSIARNLLI